MQDKSRCPCGGRWQVDEPTKNGLGYKLHCSQCDKRRTVTTSLALAIVYGGQQNELKRAG